jgi:plastocyanin
VEINIPKITTSLVALVLAAIVCAVTVRLVRADAPQPAASTGEVHIDNFTFQAQTLTVAPGTEVTWINRDDIPHTVVSTDQVFKSKALDSDDKFTYKFTQPGTYKYFCSIHPKMTGEIIVK